MSDQSTARKIQHRYGVHYSTALSWVRDESNRSDAGNTRREGQPFAARLVEVVEKRYGLRPVEGQTDAPHSSGKSEKIAPREGRPPRRSNGNKKASTR